jgi:hypothetical protein
MSERLTKEEKNTYSRIEASFRRNLRSISLDYETSSDPEGVVKMAKNYIKEKRETDNPDEQGRVDAFIEFLKKIQ